MNTSKLPPELRDQNPRKVSELRPGESGHVIFTDLLVTKDGDCFLRAPAELRRKSISTIEVRCDDAGYHVVVPSDIKYTPGAIQWIGAKLPVASIGIGPAAGLVR